MSLFYESYCLSSEILAKWRRNNFCIILFFLVILRGYVVTGISDVDSLAPAGKTRLCFLFGTNIGHSLSPEIHKKWFQSLNLNCVYLPFVSKNQNDFLLAAQGIVTADNFLGANVTHPFKSSVLNLNDVIQSETVKKIKSANTIYKNTFNQLCLENTDIIGFTKSIEQLIQPQTYFEMLVLGGGGAAVTALFYGMMNSYCSQMLCVTRSPEKTIKNYDYLECYEKLVVKNLNETVLNELIYNIRKQNKLTVIVNTLPLGIGEHAEGSYRDNNLFAEQLITQLNIETTCYLDLVYFDTKPLKLAQKKLMRCLNGKTMLVAQAQESFRLWTGVLPAKC